MGKFIISPDAAGFSFRLTAKNGETIAASYQTYRSAEACKEAISSLIKCVRDAIIEDQTLSRFQKRPNPKFELFKNENGKFKFHLRGKNDYIIAKSDEYTVKASALTGIASIKKNVEDSPIIEHF